MTNSIAHDLSVMGIHTCAYIEYPTSYVGISVSYLSCADGCSRRVYFTCVKFTCGSRRIASVQHRLECSCGICIVSWALAPKLMYNVSKS